MVPGFRSALRTQEEPWSHAACSQRLGCCHVAGPKKGAHSPRFNNNNTPQAAMHARHDERDAHRGGSGRGVSRQARAAGATSATLKSAPSWRRSVQFRSGGAAACHDSLKGRRAVMRPAQSRPFPRAKSPVVPPKAARFPAQSRPFSRPKSPVVPPKVARRSPPKVARFPACRRASCTRSSESRVAAAC